MPNKPPVKKAAKKTAKKTAKKKVAKKATNTQLTIDLAPAEELALNIEKELVKLPSQATHNHLHHLGEKAKLTRDLLLGVEKVAPILCALELEHQRKLNRGSKNWTEWVKQNCEFSHKTYTKYNKVLKHARAGDIEGLDPEIVPTIAPSLMTKDELQESCELLADGLKEWDGIRQIYLELEVIKTPQRKTIDENRKKKTDGGGESESSDSENASDSASVIDLEQKRKDATFAFREPLQKIDTAISRELYRHLPAETLEEIILALTEHSKTLKKI